MYRNLINWSMSGLVVGPILLFLVSCSEREVKKVASSYGNGQERQLLFYSANSIDSSLVREVYYYQNGHKSMEINYINDSILDGAWMIWYEDGNQNAQALFENGKRKSNWQVWDFEGKLLSAGQFSMDTAYNGLPLMIRFYKEDQNENELVGVIDFYTNQMRKSEGPLKDDLKHGLWKAWYQDGTKWSEGTFQYDVSHGLHTVWHENGQKFYEGQYQLGKRIRKWTFWDKDGRVVKELDYDEINKQQELK
jgi:antitoxin component YwqK of YwqJK toxin-antitoxin module